MRYDSNLAYDLDFEANAARIETKIQEHKKQKKAKAKAERTKLHGVIAGCVAAFALCAGFMISRNVSAYESSKRVEKLQKELNTLKEYSSQKAFELDKSLDLEEVENIAMTRLNMVRPEKYQMVYVNIKQDDVTEVTAKETEGIKGLLGIFGGEK